MYDGFSEELFSGFSVDLKLDLVMLSKFLFGHDAVRLVIDDGKAVLRFKEAVHDPLQEYLLALFAVGIEGIRRKEDRERHFLPDCLCFFHESAQRAFCEGDERSDRICVLSF